MARRAQAESVQDIIQKAVAPARAPRVAVAKAPAKAAPKPAKSARETKLESELAEARARLAQIDAPQHEETDTGGHEDEVRAAAPLRRSVTRPPRELPREPTRSPQRLGSVMVQGRNGEELTRRRTQVGDSFDVPAHEIPKGWTYQWNIMTVVGEEKTDVQLEMHANGWRPVPANRHPGRWTPNGHTGAIIVRGLRLEERPIQLTAEAKAEDEGRARAQVRDQTDALRLSKKIPEGMAIQQKYRGTGADVRISIDQALDIPRPEHQLEE